jgi:hypothetical protein
MPIMFALVTAALAVLASIGSWLETVGGYWEFFAILAVAAAVAAGSLWADRAAIARIIAVAWDAVVLYAFGLLAWFGQVGLSSPPPGPPQHFLGVTLVAWHIAAAYGGGLLLTLAAFGSPHARRARPETVG